MKVYKLKVRKIWYASLKDQYINLNKSLENSILSLMKLLLTCEFKENTIDQCMNMFIFLFLFIDNILLS